LGRTVVAEARLAKIDGRRLLFEVVARDDATVVAEGRVERVVLNRRDFLAKALGLTESDQP